ncbi:hypothetical protein WT24_13455 [Burkholderia sp. MSMB1078WGS]|uniref:hypothetical protein n=1 Tax=Burkholderia sp. MSMB1078WGS TaxID=1637900 RepID=UPI000754FDBA|nr:hypothetical protein [Burkholderia sp. MSMB1078WGS]KVT10847.1 hypothetical protein WT24_13455 [Burkholderia sp. MSMB1078WGS]
MTAVATFEPLFPEDSVLDPLLGHAAERVDALRRWLAVSDTPLATALVPQLRAMNSVSEALA